MSISVITLHSINDIDPHYAISEDLFSRFLLNATDKGYYFSDLPGLLSEYDYDKHHIVLTFDDAYQSIVNYALPHMKEFGITGTVFVITDAVGGTNEWNRRAHIRMEHCSWDDIEKLLLEGWMIGSHSHRHFNLLALNDDEVCFEIEQSNKLLESRLGIRPDIFAYPYGRYDKRIAEIVSKYYKWAVATENGGTDLTINRFTFQRLWPLVLPEPHRSLFC